MPRNSSADGQAVRAGLEHPWKRDVDALRRRRPPTLSTPATQRERSGARDAPAAAGRRASARGSTGSANSVSSRSLGLLVAGGADLRAREQAHGEHEEDEHEPEIPGGRRDRAGAELRELPLQVAWRCPPRRRSSRPCRSSSANTPIADQPTRRGCRARRAAPARSARRAAAAAAARCRCAGSSPVPTSRRVAIAPAASVSSTQLASSGSSRTSGCAPANGRSSSAQPSGVTQRSHPSAAGGVGDHAQQQRQADDGAAQLEREPARRRELARERAHPHEHRHDGRRSRARGRRSRRRQAAGEQAGEHRQPQDRRAGRDRRQRREIRRLRGAPTPASTSSSRPASSSARSARTAASTPKTAATIASVPPTRQARVAADGQQVVRLAVEQPHRVVAAEAVGEREPVGERRVGAAVAGRLDVGVRSANRHANEDACGTRASRERAPRRESRYRRHGRRLRRSGAGRSPRATARGWSAPTTGWPASAASSGPTLPAHLEAQRVRARRGSHCTPGSAPSSAQAPSNVTSIVCALRWRSSCERPLVDQPARAQDPDAVAQRLDLAEDVRGEEHRLPALLRLATVSRNATSISGSRPLVGSSSISSSARRREAPRSAAPSGGCPSTARAPSWRCRAGSARRAASSVGRHRRRPAGARGTRTSPRP